MPVGELVGFCSCGNPAHITCQLCWASMCTNCDVLSRPVTDLEAWPVQVVGFGYVNHVWDYRYRYLNQPPQNGGPYGPFLYLNELLSSLASAHGLPHRNGSGPVQHLCWPCLYTAVPDTAERIANGLMCETPKCVNEPCERCRCCSGAFCEACMSQLRFNRSAPCKITWAEPGSEGGEISVDGEVLRVIGTTIDRSVVPAMPRGLCAICSNERHHLQKELSERIVGERYAGLLVPAPPAPPAPLRAAGQDQVGRTAAFHLPAVKRRTHRGRLEERARAREVLERCVPEIAQQLEKLPLAPCRRAWAFAQGRGYAYYVVLDQRRQMTPTAAVVA